MRPSPSFAVLVGVLAIACTGKEGPAGPAGQQGPAGPITRLASYCNTTAASVSSANSWTLSVACTAAADMPVEGWCMPIGQPPAGSYLATSAPVSWNDLTVPAGWTCTWGWDPAATKIAFNAQAEICCATPH